MRVPQPRGHSCPRHHCAGDGSEDRFVIPRAPEREALTSVGRGLIPECVRPDCEWVFHLPTDQVLQATSLELEIAPFSVELRERPFCSPLGRGHLSA